LIHAGELEAHPFFFLNFKGIPSQQKHKTIVSGLKIYDMALSDQNNILGFFQLRKINYQISSIGCRLCPVRWPYGAIF
jgi:hypothetical protein